MKILVDIRALPPSAFELPDDGSKRGYLSLLRKLLAVTLATYANSDGTEVFPSSITLAEQLGKDKRTVFRLLDDLRTLGILHDGGIHGRLKTRIRSLRAPVTNARTPESEQNGTRDIYAGSPVTNRTAPVTNAQAPVTNTFVTQPPVVDPHHQPPSSTTPVKSQQDDGWEEGFFLAARVYDRLDAMPKKVRTLLMAETKKRGFSMVKCAVDFFLRESFDGAKAPWLLFLSKADSLFAKAEVYAKENVQEFRKKYIPGVAEQLEKQFKETLTQHDEELRREREAVRARTNVADISELLS